jgi:hypothetical protein
MTEIVRNFPQKALKGIDKMKMWFIIGLWGKVGKRGDSHITGTMESAKVGDSVVNRGERHV